jgi:hypothetical protein
MLFHLGNAPIQELHFYGANIDCKKRRNARLRYLVLFNKKKDTSRIEKQRLSVSEYGKTE